MQEGRIVEKSGILPLTFVTSRERIPQIVKT
jgi:hypothetical protein